MHHGIYEIPPFVLRQILMIEGGEQHDSLEELFTLQDTEELKVIVRYKLKRRKRIFSNYLETS